MNRHAFPHLPHRRLRSPRNRSACLWYLLDLTSRGYRYHTQGMIQDGQRVPGFVEKLHERFGVLLSPSGRRKRAQRGEPTAYLVMYQDFDGVWLWWLLFAGVQERVNTLAGRYNEELRDAERTDGRLSFRSEYILRQRQRPREAGGGRAWTWFMTRRRQDAVERELVRLASSHGRATERTDDLNAAVDRLRNRPMFGGVRLQASHALLRARRVWVKTHCANSAVPACVTEPLPWFNGRIKVFD